MSAITEVGDLLVGLLDERLDLGDSPIALVKCPRPARHRLACEEQCLGGLGARELKQRPQAREQRLLGRMICHGVPNLAEQPLLDVGESPDETVVLVAEVVVERWA